MILISWIQYKYAIKGSSLLSIEDMTGNQHSLWPIF